MDKQIHEISRSADLLEDPDCNALNLQEIDRNVGQFRILRVKDYLVAFVSEALEVIHSEDKDFFDTAKVLLIPAPFLAFKLYSMIRRGYNMTMPVDLNSMFLK